MKRIAGYLLVYGLSLCYHASGQSSVITTVAGNGAFGFSGDGVPATSAELNGPWGVAVDASGNLFIADYGNGRIRKVSTSGIITTVTTVIAAAVAVDASGNLFVADANNNRIRKVPLRGLLVDPNTAFLESAIGITITAYDAQFLSSLGHKFGFRFYPPMTVNRGAAKVENLPTEEVTE
jgi:hypothetical protein